MSKSKFYFHSSAIILSLSVTLLSALCLLGKHLYTVVQQDCGFSNGHSIPCPHLYSNITMGVGDTLSINALNVVSRKNQLPIWRRSLIKIVYHIHTIPFVSSYPHKSPVKVFSHFRAVSIIARRLFQNVLNVLPKIVFNNFNPSNIFLQYFYSLKPYFKRSLLSTCSTITFLSDLFQ